MKILFVYYRILLEEDTHTDIFFSVGEANRVKALRPFFMNIPTIATWPTIITEDVQKPGLDDRLVHLKVLDEHCIVKMLWVDGDSSVKLSEGILSEEKLKLHSQLTVFEV